MWLGDSADTDLPGGGGWAFIEGSPAGGGETFSAPCDKWFCGAAKFGVGSGPNRTRVYATTYGRAAARGAHYPMAWDVANHDIAGVERTELYERACGACP